MTDNALSRQVRSIELNRYLPFDENSEIVKLNDSLPLEGELPVIDGKEIILSDQAKHTSNISLTAFRDLRISCISR